MKRFIQVAAVFLAALTAVSLTACENGGDDSNSTAASDISYSDTQIVSGDAEYEVVCSNSGSVTLLDGDGSTVADSANGDAITVENDGVIAVTDSNGSTTVMIPATVTVSTETESGVERLSVTRDGDTATVTQSEWDFDGNILSEEAVTNWEEAYLFDSSAAAVAEMVTSLSTSDATEIMLNDTTVEINGSGAAAAGSVVTIRTGGTYVVRGTLSDGQIIVDAEKQDVVLYFDNASITCSYRSPLFVYKSSQTTLYLADDTANILTDGTSYTYNDNYSSEGDEEPNACLYSKSDLLIVGDGSLTVNANSNNGITSKDTLSIVGADITVNAANHGINGKDFLLIADADIVVNSGGDALRSTNDVELGYISIAGSNLSLTAGEDGIQAESNLTIKGNSSYAIQSGGGSSVTPDSEISAKGLKATVNLVVTGGIYALDCSDDAVHANGNITIAGGDFAIATGDDGMHADYTLTVLAGRINITRSYEGLEGAQVEIGGGTVFLTASDDGINAAGGVDGAGTGDFFGGGMEAANDEYYIDVTGGYVVIYADGDGLDSNGNIFMTAGTVLVYGPTNDGNGALDYAGNFYMEGGIFLAAGAAGMAQSPNNSTQNAVSVTFDQTLSTGQYIRLQSDDGAVDVVIEAQKNMQNLVYSAPELATGLTLTVSYGGSYSGGTITDGIASGGEYSGGTVLTTLVLSEELTTYGRVGIGGSMGGQMAGTPGMQGPFGGEGGRR